MFDRLPTMAEVENLKGYRILSERELHHQKEAREEGERFGRRKGYEDGFEAGRRAAFEGALSAARYEAARERRGRNPTLDDI